MVRGLDRLTVLGVDPNDHRLPAELPRFVPDDADAIYRVAFRDPSLRSLARAAVVNPPVALWLLLVVAYRRARRGDEPPASTAVSTVARDRTVRVVDLSVEPLVGIDRQSRWWTAGAWATTAVLVGTIAALAVQPGPLTISLALVSLPLVASFVLAHSGAHIRYRAAAVAAAVFDTTARRADRRPVVVVRESLVPELADRAKDRRVDTDAREVSTDLTADASLR